MMKYDVIQVTGCAFLVLGGQNVIRQIINPADAGLLVWVPGGPNVQIAVGAAITFAGAALAGWAYARARQFDRRGDDKQADDRDSDWL